MEYDYDSDSDSDIYGGDGTSKGAKKNLWIKFLKTNGGKGYTRSELSKFYKKAPRARLPKAKGY
jgi:hypothetical protein